MSILTFLMLLEFPEAKMMSYQVLIIRISRNLTNRCSRKKVFTIVLG